MTLSGALVMSEYEESVSSFRVIITLTSDRVRKMKRPIQHTHTLIHEYHLPVSEA